MSPHEIGDLLPFEILLLLFKSDDLDIISEDHLLQIFAVWYDASIRSDSEIEKLVELMRWRYINMTKFLDLISGNFPT
jgi:hypothetical protein